MLLKKYRYTYAVSFFFVVFNLLPHEHIYCEKWPFSLKSLLLQVKTTMKLWKCFNTGETWHKCWLGHSVCNSMLNRKYSVTVATKGRLKIAKITILHCFFPSKLISKCYNFSMNWVRVKGFSASVTSYPRIDLPPSGNPLMYHFDRGRRRKSGHFLTTFLKQKTVFGA
jgi:hypothetical protein